MSKKKTWINDPDFGPIEIPSVDISAAEWNETRERLRARLMQSRLWKPGRVYECPECGRREFKAVQDISQEVRRGEEVVVLRNLHGGRCAGCGFRLLDGREELLVDDEFERLMGNRHRASVSRIGRGTLGTYWPKDVERGLELAAGDELEVHLLSPESAVLHVVRTRKSKRAPRRQGSKRRSS